MRLLVKNTAAIAATVLLLTGCTVLGADDGVQGALTFPEGSSMCVEAEPGEVFAFGMPVKNDTDAVITIASVGAGQSGIEIEGPWLVPPASGDRPLPVFIDEFPPASDLADWEARVDPREAAIQPGEEDYIVWSLTLAAGSSEGRLDGIAVLNGDAEGTPAMGVFAALTQKGAATAPGCDAPQ